MFVYSVDDITRNLHQQHPPRRAALYTEGLSRLLLAASIAEGIMQRFVRLSPRHIHRDSPGRSMRRGQRTFRLDNENIHTC